MAINFEPLNTDLISQERHDFVTCFSLKIKKNLQGSVSNIKIFSVLWGYMCTTIY